MTLALKVRITHTAQPILITWWLLLPNYLEIKTCLTKIWTVHKIGMGRTDWQTDDESESYRGESCQILKMMLGTTRPMVGPGQSLGQGSKGPRKFLHLSGFEKLTREDIQKPEFRHKPEHFHPCSYRAFIHNLFWKVLFM